MSARKPFPDGHFYSPIIDAAFLERNRERIWATRSSIPGIDFNDGEHERVLKEAFPRFIGEFDYAEHESQTSSPAQYFIRNTQFGWLDARALFVLLRELAPRRIIEVGSGYSSLLMADVIRRWNPGCELTCIEPFPREILRKGVPGISGPVISPVQDVPVARFEELSAGDVLFIDSSHVSKTGSDVNYLHLEVLPRLKPGVMVHIHDVFLPAEYPQDWVLGEGRSWNEQYVVQALLMHSTRFRVHFSSMYAFLRFPQLVRSALRIPESKHVYGGSSLWIRTT